MNRYAAVDLGASSGRVIAGEVGESVLDVAEVHRFDNEPVHLPDGLHWDVLGLYREVRAGLAKAGPVRSAGIDSWAVDYGLVDADGALLGLPYHYRDERIHKPRKAPTDLYDITGIADLPFNTIHQLLTEPAFRLAAARHVLLIPDLLGYWLTGELGAERTNASTTALYDVRTGDWARELMASVDLPPALFPKLRDPGTVIGPITGSIAGRDGVELVAVASHDTASAVAAVPASSDRFAYISCGTWSLVGVELDAPVLTEASRLATFTNETGVGGTIRYLRNVMGLWLLQECQRAWGGTDVGALLAAAEEAKPFAALVDVNDPVFLPPGDMPSRIADRCDGQVPDSPGAFTRCVLESLAVGHRLAVHDAMRLSGRAVDTVHIVGGGARNALLYQLTADACGLPVVAGPVEATALGNLLAQAMAYGTVRDLAQARALVAATQRLEHYEPREPRAWDAAADRVLALR
jgi:rhamnulokinase